MEKTYLTEQGTSLNIIKLKILNNAYDEDTAKIIANAFDKNISEKLLDNKVTLEEFDAFLRSLKKYILSKEEVLKAKEEKIKKQYDDALMAMGCKKFLLNYNDKEDTISIKRMISISVNYYEKFFGVTKVTPKENDKSSSGYYSYRDNSYSHSENLNRFYYTFMEAKLNQVAKAIKEGCEGTTGFIKPSSRGIEIISNFSKKDRKVSIYLCINRKSLKSIAGHIDRMESFLDICDEMEEKYLQRDLYL